MSIRRVWLAILGLALPLWTTQVMAAPKPDWQKHIDWSISNYTTDPAVTNCPGQYAADLQCTVFGGRACLMGRAILLAKQGQLPQALQLTLITQCHNKGAQDAISSAGANGVGRYLRAKPYQPLADDKLKRLHDINARLVQLRALTKEAEVEQAKLVAEVIDLSKISVNSQIAASESDAVNKQRLTLLLSNINDFGTMNGRIATAVGAGQGSVCNGGQCADIPFWAAIAAIVTADLTQELNKPHPFGQNNEITKVVHGVGHFVGCIFGCTD